jgi:hypothetical protein
MHACTVLRNGRDVGRESRGQAYIHPGKLCILPGGHKNDSHLLSVISVIFQLWLHLRIMRGPSEPPASEQINQSLRDRIWCATEKELSRFSWLCRFVIKSKKTVNKN